MEWLIIVVFIPFDDISFIWRCQETSSFEKLQIYAWCSMAVRVPLVFYLLMLLGLQHRRCADLPLRLPQHLYEWLHADRPRPAQNRPQTDGGLCDLLQLYTGTIKISVYILPINIMYKSFYPSLFLEFTHNGQNSMCIMNIVINEHYFKDWPHL